MIKNNFKSKFKLIFQIVEEYINKGKVPSAVLGLIDINKNSYISAKGFKQIIPSKKFVNKKTFKTHAHIFKKLVFYVFLHTHTHFTFLRLLLNDYFYRSYHLLAILW